MGVLLDSSVSIKAERLGWNVERLLEAVLESVGEQELGVSTIVLSELLHGIYRVAPGPRRRQRERFLWELVESGDLYPYTLEAAKIAGRIGGEQAALGLTIPFVDLMIGATAISLGFSILTANERHFRLIPGLQVIPF